MNKIFFECINSQNSSFYYNNKLTYIIHRWLTFEFAKLEFFGRNRYI